jgi:type 1 glutamine amidotransferase/mono/diheme cytochrome c family protein
MFRWLTAIGGCVALVLACSPELMADDAPKRILVIAGKKSHGPEGNGIHDYGWSARLIKVMLDHSNVRDQVLVEVATDGWPKEASSLQQADSIMIISDGRDGELFEEAPHLSSPEHVELISKEVRRGCGLVTFHFSTFAPDRYADQILDWVGGYFDWETNGKRDWYSAIQVADTAVAIASPEHPVSRGVMPFTLKEEFYFNLRLHPLVGGMTPLLRVQALPGRDPTGNIVAWARQRPQGGRGFGTTCGHFYENWRQDDFRKLILNGLVWSAGVDIPPDGVKARFYERAEIDQALSGKVGVDRSQLDESPIRVLLLAGNEAHQWHNWKKTTPAIVKLLQRDPRIQVDVRTDIESLGDLNLADFQTVLLNYCNWQDPTGLSDKSKRAFVAYLEQGGGLVIVHFANGAFHFSLPSAAASDWPEYRRIVRRAWDHQGKGESQSGHDAFGLFEVKPTSVSHPTTAGLAPFTVTDELYFRQAGDEAIEPLLLAHSKVTDRDEPLAFSYRYGKGRIFQTLLGHSEQTYETFEAREILRRAVAWCASRPVVARTKDFDPDVAQGLPPKGEVLAEGRFGKAIDARVASCGMSSFSTPKVEQLHARVWVRLESAKGYNILLAYQPKSSPIHWEVFTEPGTGQLTLYSPKMIPDHVRAENRITDGRWHMLDVSMTRAEVQLRVDGESPLTTVVENGPTMTEDGPLSVGSLVEGGLGCDGWLDDLHWRDAPFSKEVPTEPMPVDSHSLGHWRFDSIIDNNQLPDESVHHRPMLVRDPTKVAEILGPVEDPHFLEGSVGFHWRENDSADDRWNQADVGPFLASVLPLPTGGLIARGLSIALPGSMKGGVAYDLASMWLVAGWTGGFLRFDRARHGLITSPRIQGKVAFAFPPRADPPISGKNEYRGLYRVGREVVLASTIDATGILEWPSFRVTEGRPSFLRTWEVAPSEKPTRIYVAQGESITLSAEGRAATVGHSLFRLQGDGRWYVDEKAPDSLWLEIPPGKDPRYARTHWTEAPSSRDIPMSLIPESDPIESLAEKIRSTKPIWNEEVSTVMVPSDEQGPYAIDDFPLPHQNPYRSLCFPSDHDFLPNGDLAVSMVHGDVWMARGVGSSKRTIHWRRFASGLHQPLGLKVKENDVYVLGRDQITRLVDRDQDGEADFYENYFANPAASVGGHDFEACLETDPEGRFLFVSATQGLVRVRPDHRGVDILATGFRNPNGLGVRPASMGKEDWITVSPQEGNWTPSSSINLVRPGGFYGFRSGKEGERVPTPIDPPLCWIPRLLDNSSGSQVWTDAKRFGPLGGQMLHLSYGQCRVFLAMTEQVGTTWQGGVVALPWAFRSGIMRGRVNPADGQLYLSGLKGWVSAAVDDGSLSRVRYTNKPFAWPRSVETWANGLLIRFSEPIDVRISSDPDRYSLSAWNYRYSAQYGSPEINPRDPQQEGKEEWAITSATVLEDGRSVFLEVPSLTPVMQLLLAMKIESARHDPIQTTLAYTIHTLPTRAMPDEEIVRRPRPGSLPPAIESRLRAGVAWKVEQDARRDVAITRSWAWVIPKGTALAHGIRPGPFRATAVGYVKAPESAHYRFRWSSTGRAKLILGQQPAIEFESSAGTTTSTVSLHRGYNAYRIEFESAELGKDVLRMLWSSDGFAEEPIPPTLLFFDSQDENVSAASTRTKGLTLLEEHRCWNCHAGRPAGISQGPDLAGIGSRLTKSWLTEWLADPKQLRAQATMPSFFRAGKETDDQDLADVVAYLASLTSPKNAQKELPEATEPDHAFVDLGCLACHTLEPSDALGHDRISLARVGWKFQPGALASYLKDPAAHHATTRMPNYHLTDDEIGSLVSTWKKSEPSVKDERPLPAGDTRRGKERFLSIGCSQCHRVDTDRPATNQLASPLSRSSKLDRGCLAETPSPSLPWYDFTPTEREAIASYLASQEETAPTPSLVMESRRHFEQHRCHACHSRDGVASPRASIFLEESPSGLPPEPIPDLTWAGEKLRTNYVSDLLLGKTGTQARPWLKGRMPAFSHGANDLASGMAAEFGVSLTPEEWAFSAKPDLTKVGKELTGLSTGLDCRQCHPVGAAQPIGDDRTQLALGINFAQIKDRLRYEHYRRFVLDPPRYDVSTRMPKLSLDGRTTKLKNVLGGNASLQFEAIWHYIQSLDSAEIPSTSRANP